MTREAEFHAILSADATLLAILTGGVYKTESTGVEGITRATTPTAFDGSGYLLPCALIHARAIVPDGMVRDFIGQKLSLRQVLEVYIYSDDGAGYTALEAAADRIFALLQGRVLSDTFEIEIVNTLPVMRDEGGLAGAAMTRLDFLVVSVKE